VRDAVYRHGLAVADVMAVALALFVGLVALGDDAFTLPLLVTLPVVVLISKALGLYDRDQHVLKKTTLDEAPRIFEVATLYILLILIAGPLFVAGQPGAEDGHVGRNQLVGLWGFLFAFMVIARVGARRLARSATLPERCLVIGDARAATAVRSRLESSPRLHARLVGRVRLEDEPALEAEAPEAASLLGGVQDLGVVLASHDIERVIIAPTSAEYEEILDTIRLVKALGVKVSILPRLFEVIGSTVEFDDLDGATLLGVRPYGLTRSSEFLKRVTDLVVASLTVVLLSPLAAGIAIAIKASSRGPVFFRQPRIGRHGQQFQMVKFRTMHEGADEQKAELRAMNESEGLFKIAADPRLTRVGRFLRRSSLDELPQLWNVLRGEMSLVGPRPLVPDEDSQVEGWSRRRLYVAPGMTGLWQVLGSSRVPLHEMVKIDYVYGANWSLWLDMKIMLRTVPHVLGRRGL